MPWELEEDEGLNVTGSKHRLNMHPVIEKEKKEPVFTRGKIVSLMLSMVLLAYSLLTGDVPFAFLLSSLIIFLLRPLAEKLVGEWLSNLMKGFAISLGFGSLAMLLL